MADTTTLAGLLKTVYDEKEIYEQIRQEVPTLEFLEKNKNMKKADGTGVTIFAHTGRNASTSAMAETAALPTAGYQGITQMSVDYKITANTIELSSFLMEATKGNKGAIASALATEMEGAKTDMRFDLNRQFHGDGTGAICLANGAGSSTATLTVDGQTSGETATQHLLPGMYIDIFDAETGALEVDGIQISSVDSATQVTLASSQTWTDNSLVCIKDTRVYSGGYTNYSMMGFKGIVDDGTYAATFQGKTRSSNTWLNAQVGTGSGVISEYMIQSAISLAKKNGAMVQNLVIFMPWDLHDKLASLLAANRRYSYDSVPPTYTGGWLGVSIAGVKIIPEMDMPSGTVYVVDKAAVTVEEMCPMGFENADGAELSRVSGYLKYAAVLRYFANMAARRCSSSVVLRSVTTA